MVNKGVVGSVLGAILAFATPSSAQITPNSPTSNLLRISFTGTVTNDVDNTIRIRQPNGTTIPFTGPVPEYPYQQGDRVAISFVTQVPNRDFYSSPLYTGQVAADGIYRINVTSPATGTPGTLGYANTADISGPIGVENRGGPPLSIRGVTIVYDAVGDLYSLELGSGGWSLANLDVPSYTYDGTTGTVVARNNACIGVQCESANILLTGNATAATIGSPFGQNIGIGTTAEPSFGGFFDAIGLSGSFNLPIFGGSSTGGPVDVPEPSMLLLFGGGAALVIRRRRKAVA